MKQLILSCVVVLLASLTPSQPAWALTDTKLDYQCGEETWVTPPLMVDGRFSADLIAECTVKGASAKGLALLDQHLLDDATHGPGLKQIHAGPTAETFDGLASIFYDASYVANPVEIRNDIHIATDRKTRLVYMTHSTDIIGHGWSKYLHELNVTVRVSPSGNAGDFRLSLEVSTLTDRPWFAPSKQFAKAAEKPMHDQFRQERDRVLPQISSQLAQ